MIEPEVEAIERPPLVDPWPQDGLPILYVHLDVEAERLAWRMDGRRWRSGFRSLADACADAEDAGCPAHCVIEFVETR